MAFAILFDGVGVGEWFVLLAVVLVVVGPKRLPAAARKFGQHYSRFRRAAESFKRQLLDMDNEVVNAVRDARNEMESAAREVENEINSSVDEFSAGYGRAVEDEVKNGDRPAEES